MPSLFEYNAETYIYDKSKLMSYLNGFLLGLENLNYTGYTSCTFYFDEIKKTEDSLSNQIIKNHIFKKNPIKTDWIAQCEKIENFDIQLRNALNNFCSTIFINEYALNEVSSSIYTLIYKIVGHNFNSYKVTIVGNGWYEASYEDFLFETDDTLFFLHFGVSD